MIVIGVTGSIGMGKSAVAAMFERCGVPAHDSDAAVHELIGGQAKEAIAAAFPQSIYPQIYEGKNKNIIRGELGKIIFASDEKRKILEDILHPMVRIAQNEFIRKSGCLDFKKVVLDIPLLFETGADETVDVTVVASAPYEVQRARVLERPGMTEEKFHAILARQMPDAEKKTRADFIVHTGLGRAHAMRQVKEIISSLSQ